MATKCADRISRLPDDVRLRILTFLPLRDAGKSSILSSKWRDLWIKLPTLVIDKTICESEDVNKVMLNIYRVLSLHGGPLKGLCLSHTMLVHEASYILRILPYQNLENLTIKTAGGYFKLPKRVFSSFSRLKKLLLACCKFTFSPISFEGFDLVTVLELCSVRFQKNLTQLRFKCPLLTTLNMEDCGTSRQKPIIVIEEASNLSCFNFAGCFESLRLEHTPCLKEVFIEKMDAWSDVKRFGPNLLETNGGLAAVESLSVAGDFYEYLATGDIPNLCTINEPWKKLRRLRLDELCLETESHVWSVVCMIIASPNLQQLSIELEKCYNSSMAGFAGYREASGIMHSGAVTASKPYTSGKLTRVEVEMEMVSSTRNEMTLIKWLLNISPMLEEMKIQLSTELSDAEKFSISAELNGVRRASNRAQITLE